MAAPSSPLDHSTLLWSKYWIRAVPLLGLAVVITFITSIARGIRLHDDRGIFFTIGFTVAASAMACDEDTLSPVRGRKCGAVPTNWRVAVHDGQLTLLGVIIAAEAAPVATYLQARASGEELGDKELVVAFGVVFMMCTAATVVSIGWLARLREMEV